MKNSKKIIALLILKVSCKALSTPFKQREQCTAMTPIKLIARSFKHRQTLLIQPEFRCLRALVYSIAHVV